MTFKRNKTRRICTPQNALAPLAKCKRVVNVENYRQVGKFIECWLKLESLFWVFSGNGPKLLSRPFYFIRTYPVAKKLKGSKKGEV